MIDLIERIGPYLGIAAFLGLAILAFLIFQQAREVRRLREWAGRAPERAAEAREASAVAAEAKGEAAPAPEEAPDTAPGLISRGWERVKKRAEPVLAEVNRRSPVDPRYFLAVIAAAVIAAGVLTSGFGLFGSESDGKAGGGHKNGSKSSKKVEVAVLNATQIESGGTEIQGVQGLASEVANKIVKPAGFKAPVNDQKDAPTGFPDSVIMYVSGQEAAAGDLASAVSKKLGTTDTQEMTGDISAVVGKAPLALIVGSDDANVFGTETPAP
jgi:LytR cell envelope-related transcriptional attenuator